MNDDGENDDPRYIDRSSESLWWWILSVFAKVLLPLLKSMTMVRRTIQDTSILSYLNVSSSFPKTRLFIWVVKERRRGECRSYIDTVLLKFSAWAFLLHPPQAIPIGVESCQLWLWSAAAATAAAAAGAETDDDDEIDDPKYISIMSYSNFLRRSSFFIEWNWILSMFAMICCCCCCC